MTFLASHAQVGARKMSTIQLWRLLAPAVGALMLLALCVLYMINGYSTIRSMDAEAAAQGKVIVSGPGDPAHRDIPQALAMANGRWYDDGSYIDEVHWYPFMTPLIVAGYMVATGEPLQSAYRIGCMLISIASLPALAWLLSRYVGRLAYLALAVVLLFSIYWPSNSNYPVGSSYAAFFLFLGVAASAFERVGSAHSHRWMFAAGISAGWLAIWHGASFITAGVVVAALMGFFTLTQWRSGWRRVLAGTGLAALGLFLGCAPLFVPQLLCYGRIQQSDVARLFVNPVMYGEGNNTAAFLHLELLPNDWDTALPIVFLVILVVARSKRLWACSAPLLISYVLGLGLGQLGYIMNGADFPWLVALANRFIPSPPHTFAWISDTILMAVRCLAVALLLSYALAALRWLVGRWRPRALRWAEPTLLALALIGSYGWVIAHLPTQGVGHIEYADQQMFQFAEEVSRRAVHQSVYVHSWAGQRDIFDLMPFKVVLLHSPLHSNPYHSEERSAAEQELARPQEHAAELTDLVQRYQIGYVLTMPDKLDVVANLCGGTPVARSPQGHILWQISAPCRVPTFGPILALAPADRLGLQAHDSAAGVAVAGVKAGNEAKNFIAFPATPAGEGELVELVFSGKVVGPAVKSCLSPQADYVQGERKVGSLDFDGYYPAEGSFELHYWIVTPQSTTMIVPKLRLGTACFAQGQSIVVENIRVAHETTHH